MKRFLLFIVFAAVCQAAQPTGEPTTQTVTKNSTTNAVTSDLLIGAGRTLTVNGLLAGTPTGGTLDLSNLTLTLPATSGNQPADADLTAIAALASTGILARTASNTWAQRTLTAASSSIVITNGAGIAGNPTFDTAQSILTSATPTFAGLTLNGVLNVDEIHATSTGSVQFAGPAAVGTPSYANVANGGNQLADRGVSFDLKSPGTGLGASGVRTTARLTTASVAPTTYGGYLDLYIENTSGVMTRGARLTEAGNFNVLGGVGVGTGLSTQDALLELGDLRSGNGYAYVDLHGDTTYTDYSLRLGRDNTGANAPSHLTHRGTGALVIETLEAGAITFKTTSTTALTLAANGAATFASTVALNGATASSSTSLIVPASTTGVSSFRVPHGSAPTSPVNGDIWTTTSGLVARINGSSITLGTGTGDVVGPGSATDTAIAVFDGTTGKLVKNTGITIDGSNNMAGIAGLTVTTLSFTNLSGTAGAANGGTGIASYAVGDLLYASGSTTLSKLADVATGNVLISGGVTTAPAWGKVALTTHVSGTLPVANGGTGITALGTGVATALGLNTGSAGALVTFNGALGTPSSGNASGITVFPKADVLEASLFAADAGSNDTYVITLSPAITAYVTGAHYWFKANTANTGAATIDINSRGAKTIVKVAGGITTALADNDIRAGQWVDLVYDGTNMQMQSTLGNAASGGIGDLTTLYISEAGPSMSAGDVYYVGYESFANNTHEDRWQVSVPRSITVSGFWVRFAYSVTGGDSGHSLTVALVKNAATIPVTLGSTTPQSDTLANTRVEVTGLSAALTTSDTYHLVLTAPAGMTGIGSLNFEWGVNYQ